MSLDKFIRVADTLVVFDASLNDKDFPMSSIHSLDVHSEELKSIWEKLKLSYEECISDIEASAGGDTDDESAEPKDENCDLTTVKNKYKSAYLTYCRCNTRLRELIQELTPSMPTQDSSSHKGFKLPPCEIPIFSGDYSTWPTFRDMFTAVCIKNPRLSSVEKLFHLNQRTKNEPNDIVKVIPLTNENFQLVWTNLCSRYENKRVLINNQLKALLGLTPIPNESAIALKTIQRDINTCMSMLKLYDVDVESWDPIFIFVCSNCLPNITLTLWEQTLTNKSVIPKWSKLDAFLTNRHRTLESVSEIRKTIEPNGKPKSSTSHKSDSKSSGGNIRTFQNNVSAHECHLCPKEVHPIRKCPRFLKMTQEQKYTEIKNRHLCINCFSKLHSVKNCTSKFSCFKCKSRHNTLLHKDKANLQTCTTNVSSLNPNSTPFNSSSHTIQSTTSPENSVIQTCFSTNYRSVLLGTAIVQVSHNGLVYSARALLDSGSEGTFILERLFHIMKLPFTPTYAKISGLNNTISAAVQKECSFTLGCVGNNSIQINVSALVVPHLSGNLPSRTINSHCLSGLPKIQLADPQFYQSSKIDILLGGDILPSLMLSGIKHQICGSLMAQETVFGWILTGPIPIQSSSVNTVVSYFCEISLSKEISRFWEIEELPRKKFMSSTDEFCEKLYRSTTKRNDAGRYIVSLPFKEGFPGQIAIGHSRSSAMAQFFRNEFHLNRSPQFKEEYDNVLKEYITLGHMSKVSGPISKDSNSCYYLPHHAVLKPDSTTTKVRVVFNASSPSSNGSCLNDVLHVGPVLQNDLTILILKWRFFQYVFNGDITKMYRQILINPDHASYQRILFRDNAESPIQDFELGTVTFGVNCAPYLAIRTILQLADDVQSSYPLASDILRNSMYVDDALVGAHSISSAVEARNQLILALNSAGFTMRKWTANAKEIISDLPADHLLFENFLEFEDRSSAKTLGIRWNAMSDSFYFSAQPFPENCKYSKREVLSQISKLFDPAGRLSPCVIIAKMIMQSIWMEKTEWDDVISQESLSKWKCFQSNYLLINSIKIPRWFKYSLNCEVQFHGFSDASEKAYAAVLYIRIKNDNTIFTSLVSSKTRVAPLKTLSIPRLELCGAVLLADMLETIIPQLGIDNYTIQCWTDSKIVLSWLAKPPCFWNTFVANRVSKITQVINPSNWGHVSSESNPADYGSRGMYPKDIANNKLWWEGPPWLKDPPERWPNVTTVSPECTDIEKRHVRLFFSYFNNFEDVLDRFSSFPRAIRVIAYVYRFYHRTHPDHKTKTNNMGSTRVSCSETSFVQNRLMSISQKAYYPNEYSALSAKKSIAKSSPILNLNPFVDSEGIVRVCGRLVSSPSLNYNETHPIILPYNCQYSRLLVRFIHEISIHGGNHLVLRLIRMQFWIPKVKNLIKTTINKCKPCIIYKRRCQIQLMSALPPERSTITRPFVHTGLDFAGPFDIKNYTGRACLITKGYVCVFVCFSTKAIHLEATSDLSTTKFLAAFSRFISRRGCPLHLHSDNGTTFVGASKVLAREFIQTSQQAVMSNYAHQNITWHFIPPGAPHMGGLWEAGVKSFKLHFRKIAGCSRYTFEEFQTLLSRIESCLNSRPLYPISENPSDLAALTPGHFLIGSPILAPIDPKVGEAPMSLVNRWQKLKAIHHHFCVRWKNEYLKELHKRHKWQKPTENLRENMMVVIRDENLPPNCWRLGRICKVYSGSDNRVRIADIVTEKGTISRPITKLVLLPDENTLS